METENITNWEYLLVVCDTMRNYVNESMPYFQVILINGKKPEQEEEEQNTAMFDTKTQKVKRNPQLEEYLQIQGTQGWEVCGSSLFSTGGYGEPYLCNIKTFNGEKII